MSLVATGRFLSIFSGLELHAARSKVKALPVALVSSGIATLKNCTISPVAQLVITSAREIARTWTT